VWLFRCEGTSSEIPEISPEIPNFPETPEKSPENPGFTDKFVLSGDFSGLAYSPLYAISISFQRTTRGKVPPHVFYFLSVL
jgi:hypothetical protein